MNPVIEAVNRFKLGASQFWLARSLQERKFLAAGAGVAALALFYSILIAPAVDGRTQLQKDLPLLRQEAAEVQALARQAGELARQAPAPVAPISNGALNTSLAAHGLKPQSVAVTGEYARLQFAGVPFPALLMWLDKMRRESRVAVEDASIVGLTTPGMVDASITLHQGVGAAR
jgi:general secretion pathway protein M